MPINSQSLNYCKFDINMKSIVTLVLFLCLGYLTSRTFAGPYDSLGIRKEGKITFIIHRVDQGETVYSLSHRYHISQEELIRNNPSIRNGLKVGEELKIPLTNPPQTEDKGNFIVHTVQPSETLFGIARKYGVSTGQIRQWNGLTSNRLDVNQKLRIKADTSDNSENTDVVKGKIHIVNKGETLYSISRMYNVSTSDLKRWNQLGSDELRIGQELIVSNKPEPDEQGKMVITNDLKINNTPQDTSTITQKDVQPAMEVKPEKKVEKEGDFKKIVETGMAEVIDGSGSTQKYLAMHRTAPIGTIMQVKNLMNNLTVFVRVIGKLPDTGENTNVTIRISKTAYDRLGAIDKRFPVEISYIP